MLRLLRTRDELRAFAQEHELRSDWHEPDEQGVDAIVQGSTFDNAGFWPGERALSGSVTEKHVILKVDGKRAAAVNLATLFAWAAED